MATPRTRDPARPGGTRPVERTAGRLVGAEAGRPAWALPRHPGDAVRLAVAVAVRFGAEPAAAGVRAAAGRDRLAAASAATPTAALTRGAPAELHTRPDLRDELARLLAPTAESEPR